MYGNAGTSEVAVRTASERLACDRPAGLATESLQAVLERAEGNLKDAHEFITQIEEILGGSVPREGQNKVEPAQVPLVFVAAQVDGMAGAIRERIIMLRDRIR